MAHFKFRLPDIGEGIAEAEVVAWHVKVGDTVVEDQRVADMMTDKATVEMESPVSGIVVELAGDVGDQLAIGSTLMIIDTDGDESDAGEDAEEPVPVRPVDLEIVSEKVIARAPVEHRPAPSPLSEVAAPSSSDSSQSSAPEKRRLASPAVRQRAKDLGIDLAQIRGDGDRLRHADLDAYLRYGTSQGFHDPQADRTRPDEQIKVIGMRRRIAENMAASKRAIPHFAYVEEIDVTALEAMRATLNANLGSRPKLTMLPFLVVAICRTVAHFPMINARYDDEAGVVTRHGRVHLGIATQTKAGLMVPVIRDAQDKNVWQLASDIARLADAARNGKAKAEELSGSTLTLTSLGPLGGIATTPVINRPEVAIIGPNKIVERPVFKVNSLGHEELVRAKLMNLSISCDHRVVDGWDAASFVQALKKLIEQPVLLFSD